MLRIFVAMHLAALYRYPVKSLGGESLASATSLIRGLRDDRRWMFVDAGGTFISQRSQRRLARYRAAVEGDRGLAVYRVADGTRVALVPEARPAHTPDREVTVWDDTFRAATVTWPGLAALTSELGVAGAHLVYMNDDTHRPVDERYARAAEEVSFADGYPYLLTTDASLRALAGRFGSSLDVRRFRPNLVIAGVDEPFAEDGWVDVRVGDQRFYNAKPCARCGVITHDPDTGAVDRGVQRTLAAMRRTVTGKSLFGINCCLATGPGGALRVGDPVSITTSSRAVGR